MSNTHPAFAGIDVRARTLSVALSRPGQAVLQATFANDPQAHKRLLKWLTKGGHMVSVCLEASGLYSLGVALALHRHRHTKVMVVNPKAMSKYAQACMQPAKTDAKDALLILDYAERRCCINVVVAKFVPFPRDLSPSFYGIGHGFRDPHHAIEHSTS